MESIVEPTDDTVKYTKRAMVIRSVLIFMGYIFIFLAGANELMDVLLTFFGITITPRQALLAISLIQMGVWIFGGVYRLYKDKSFIYVGYLLFIFLFFLLSVEADPSFAIFDGLASAFRGLGTIFIILSIVAAGGYTSLTYYFNHYQE